ncbi:MAG: sigma 54-interacting transcriptional regulator [Candidatus Schekmanbacteria bacterium]|nr:sigma 54-interacting transcriptional regulator [Candidatus Schekmanbacteria bacterium]
MPDMQTTDGGTAAQRHLDALRALLRRDFLRRASWGEALRDVAQMAIVALEADEALVALYDGDGSGWTACTRDGELLQHGDIGMFGSVSVLEEVRRTTEPLLTVARGGLPLTSESIVEHQVQSVLAVPLFWWNVAGDARERCFGGCLYAHRSVARAPFTPEDVSLVLDVAELAERNLNLLRHLRAVQTDLQRSEARLEETRQAVAREYRFGNYETRDRCFAENVIEPLRRVAHADKIALLITGPSGSGKTHLARAYHYQCARRNGPFVVLDCGQVTSAETLAAELFGYAPSSGYANAPQDGRPGKAELAHKGTLFIDEIACLPADLQQRLLRIIQEGRYSRLGAATESAADLQIIAATNADLGRLVREGRFREDLLFRLALMRVALPDLNQRLVDIPEMAQSLLVRACAEQGDRAGASLSPAAARKLQRHDWAKAGNIRGLEYTIRRSLLLAEPGKTVLEESDIRFDELFDYGRGVPAAGAPTSAPSPASAAAAGRSGMSPPPAHEHEDAGRQAAGEARRPSSAAVRALLRRKIEEHHARLGDLAADPRVAAALGYAQRGAIPLSTLLLRLRELGLDGEVSAIRQQRQPDADQLREAILEHGSGAAAAKALGMTKDAFGWQLRKAGFTVKDILGGGE